MGQTNTSVTTVTAATKHILRGTHLDNDINGLLEGSAWNNVVNGKTVLTWSEPNSSADYAYPNTLTGVAAVTAAEDTNIRAALAEWSAVANLTFNRITETTTTHADLRFAQATATPDSPTDFFGASG